jgi:cytochrome b-561
VALICFLALVLTGVFLGFFYEPSTSEVTYEGSVAKYQGQDMPASFASVLNITYDVPYGMFLRRLHHWAAHLFVASLSLHMLRVFFTGAYRNPREPNWVVGAGLAGLSMFAAYTGYALPFDEFAATATGIGYNMAKSVPLIGDVAAKLVFGGSFPSSATIPRFYFLHVFVLPTVIAGLIAVHMAILIRQKHTENPREGDVEGRRHVDADDDSVVVGLPAFPNQAAVTAVVFFLTMATLSLLAGLLPVHNVAAYGPNDPASTPTLIMPDWFLMWVFGTLKVIPGWLNVTVLGVHVNTEFLGGVVLPGVVFAALFAWPFVDYYEDPEHFTVDPLARPWQTAVGVAGILFVMTASIAGMNTIAAEVVGVGTGTLTGLLGLAMVLVPLAGGGIVYLTLARGAEAADGSGPASASDEAVDGDGSVSTGARDGDDDAEQDVDGDHDTDDDAEQDVDGDHDTEGGEGA